MLETKDVVIAAVGILHIVLAVIVSSSCAMYSMHIQEIFMTDKRKEKNNVNKLMSLLGVLFIMNYVYIYTGWEAFIGIGGIITFLLFFAFEIIIWRKSKNNKTKVLSRYREWSVRILGAVVIFFGPIVAEILEEQNILPNRSICILVVSIVEIFALVVTMPQILNIGEARCYYLDESDSKWYLYCRLDDGSILCGDSIKSGKAGKYRIITYVELKKRTIFRNDYSITKDA